MTPQRKDTSPRLMDSVLGDLEEVRRLRANRSRLAAAFWFAMTLTSILARMGLARVVSSIRQIGRDARRAFGSGGAPRLGQAVRSLRRTPWYAATVIAVIALTTALSATVFAVVDGVLFRPLPYRDAHQLHTASGLRANGRGGGSLSLDEVRAMQRELPDVGISAFQWTHDAGTMGDGMMYGAAAVDARFFEVLGQRPVLGGFQDEHFTPGTAPVVIISNRLWRQRLGGTADAIGRQLPVAGAVDNVRRPVAKPIVVGVLPADFVFPTGELTDIIRPFALPSSESGDRNYSTASALVRVPNSMTKEEVTSRLTLAELNAQRPDLPERSRYTGASVRTLQDLGVTYRRSFRQLAAVTSTLILLACVAIATLASGRARQQERQALVRRALGATSWDLFRAAFFEAAVLIGVASTAGVLVAPIVLAMVQALMPVQDYLVTAPAIDFRAVLLVATLAVIVALVTAVASVTRSNQSTLATGSATGSTKRVRRFGRVLIATQTALAFVLILGGTLGLASLWRAWNTDPGYEPDGLVLVEVSVRTPDFKQIPPILGQLDAEFRKLPGVTSGMFGGRFLNGSWGVIGVRTLADGPAIDMQWVQTGGSFFEALDLAPVEGRLPTTEERSTGADVVVLSTRGAKSLWPNESAVGKSVRVASFSATVIGIVREPSFVGLVDRGRDAGQIYMSRGGRGETSFLLKTTGTTGAALEGARQIVAAQGSAVDLLRAVTMHDALADTIRSLRLTAWLHGGFAFSALMIVATAVLGLVAMATSQRAREFGIRCALGARRDALIAMLLREQLVTVVCGLIAGGFGAYWFQGLLRSASAGVPATDYRLWIATATTLLVTAMLGVLVPAVRSTRIDAAQTLRAE